MAGKAKLLHCLSVFADKAKINGVLYIQSSSEETSSYWSPPKSSYFLGFSLVTTPYSGLHWSAFRCHEFSTFTEKDRNKINYRSEPNL